MNPLKCANCGGSLRSIAAIDDAGVIERILKHLGVWDPQPESRLPTGPDPPWPEDQTVPLSCHPVPDGA